MLSKSLLVLKSLGWKWGFYLFLVYHSFGKITESEMFLYWVDLHQNIHKPGDVSLIKVGNKWILLLLFTSSNLGAYWAREALNIFRAQARIQMGAPGWCPLLSTPSTHRAKDFICILPSTSKLCLHPLTDICPSSSLQGLWMCTPGVCSPSGEWISPRSGLGVIWAVKFQSPKCLEQDMEERTWATIRQSPWSCVLLSPLGGEKMEEEPMRPCEVGAPLPVRGWHCGGPWAVRTAGCCLLTLRIFSQQALACLLCADC